MKLSILGTQAKELRRIHEQYVPANYRLDTGGSASCFRHVTRGTALMWATSDTLEAILEKQVRLENRPLLAQLNAGLPEMYQAATFTNWRPWGKHADQQENRKNHLVGRLLIEIDRAPGAPRSPLLWIWRGGPGTGKTHMAWAGVRAARARDIWADLVPMGDLTRELRSTWGGGEGTTEEGVLEAARAPQLLVVDEVSEHALYARVHQHVYDIVDYRLQRLRPTILITNSDKLTELFGDAVLSRVEGYGGVIDFGNDDYRRQ